MFEKQAYAAADGLADSKPEACSQHLPDHIHELALTHWSRTAPTAAHRPYTQNFHRPHSYTQELILISLDAPAALHPQPHFNPNTPEPCLGPNPFKLEPSLPRDSQIPDTRCLLKS